MLRRDATVFEVVASDVSAVGVGCRVSREAVIALAQGGSVLTPGDRLRLTLGGRCADPAEGVEFDGRVRHVRRLSRDEYLVGLVFDEPDRQQEAAIADLLVEARAQHLKG